MQQYGHGMGAQQSMMNMNSMGHMQHGGMRGFGLMNLAEEATKSANVQTLAKKPEAKKPAATELNKKAAPKTKKVTAVTPGTKKVMEEISFEKPTWKDQKGFGWANLPYTGGFAAAPEFGMPFEGFAGFEAPFAAPEFGYAGFEAPFAAPYGDFGFAAPEFGYAGFEAPFAAPEFGYAGFEAPFAAPYEEFGYGYGVPEPAFARGAAPFVEAVPEFGAYGAGFGYGAPEFGAHPYGGFEEGFYGEGPLGVWDGFDAAPFLAVPNYSWKK